MTEFGPPQHADFHRVRIAGSRMFNTADIGLVGTRSNRGAEILSSRVTLGYATHSSPDLVILDSTWFAIRAQRDASVFGQLMEQAYRGDAFTFDGIPERCSFQVAVAASSWHSNGTHSRGDGIWSSPSLRYDVGGASGRLFTSHDDFQSWQDRIRVRSDLHDLADLIQRLRLRQTFHRYDNPRQYHFELEYPLYLARQETGVRETRVYFTTPHPATAWQAKWKTPDDGKTGRARLTADGGSACLTLDGHHDEVVVDALFDSVAVGPFQSRTTPVAVRPDATATTDPTPRRKITFRVVNTHHEAEPADPSVVVLERTKWDDHGIKSSFRVYTYLARAYEPVGMWKIVDRAIDGKRQTELPRTFEKLPSSFISLGQDLSAYERLAELDRELSIAILTALHDLLLEPVADIERLEAFRTSMVRFKDARNAFDTGRTLLQRRGLLSSSTASPQRTPSDEIVLQVSAELRGFANPHVLELRFSRRPESLGLRRAVVLVGPNGCGKTQLLGALGRALCGLERRDVRLSPEAPFEHVLAVSYGAFDHFTVPRGQLTNVGYTYCGLRVAPSVDQKDDQRITLDLERALGLAAEQVFALRQGPRRDAWADALGRVRIAELDDPKNNVSCAAILDILRTRLSAGQKLVALTLANLCTHLEANSIVLHDEPETHLHPSLLSALLRAIHGLLDRFDSYALIATHSLTPLQETPSTNVILLNKSDAGTVSADRPIEQCFAATLDEISRVAFQSSLRDENFRTALKRLRERYSVEEIREFLGGQLGLGTEMLLASLQR